MANLVFLSHIHEEKKLALIFKKYLEEEFSGFVEIFVSSDGITIPAGSNFLRRIEEGLINCKAGVYLISPYSIKRNWINFELGAVWIRNKQNMLSDEPEIPTIPVCHSGMKLSDLPQPINNLNAIQGNIASQLEFAFRSIQQAVGGKGNLRSNFDKLADEVINFEREYTLGENIRLMFKLIGGETKKVFEFLDSNQQMETLTLNLGMIENQLISKLRDLENSELKGIITVTIKNPGIAFGERAINGADTVIVIKDIKQIKDFKELILG